MARKKNSGNAERSQRQLKIGEMIRQILSDIFLRVEIRDETLEGVILTVSEVRVSPDGKRATVFVSPLATDDKTPIIEALNEHKKFLRGELSRRVHLKYVPELVFELDAVFEQADAIDRLLKSDKVSQDI